MENLFYKSGLPYCVEHNGRREYFYENWQRKTVELYLDKRLHGEALLYWPNGQLKRSCSFERGVRHGLDRMWSEEGQLVDEGRYEQGKAVGAHRRYYKNGALLEEIEYLEAPRFNLRQWDEEQILRVEAIWTGPMAYREKVWDRFQQIWIEKEGFFNGKKLVYL